MSKEKFGLILINLVNNLIAQIRLDFINILF